jgi:two-component system chemotaxis response regulator CheY
MVGSPGPIVVRPRAARKASDGLGRRASRAIDDAVARDYNTRVAKVLLVDDSAVTRMMIAEFLMMSGHQVAGEAETLEQALATYQAQKPDLVTLDLSMGDVDGFTVLRALREADPKARVLIVSANTQPDVYDQLMKEGAIGFIVKPFSLADLMAAVSKALGS